MTLNTGPNQPDIHRVIDDINADANDALFIETDLTKITAKKQEIEQSFNDLQQEYAAATPERKVEIQLSLNELTASVQGNIDNAKAMQMDKVERQEVLAALERELQETENLITPPAPAGTQSEKKQSGLDKILTMAGNGAQKVGEVLLGFWEQLKPHLLKFAEMPGIAWLIGEDNLNKLNAALGVDRETAVFIKELKSRLPDNVELVASVLATKETIRFNDLYNDMLQMRKISSIEYTKIVYFNHVREENYLDYTDLPKRADGKYVLNMTDLAKAAEQYNRAEKEKTEAEINRQPTPVAASPAPSSAATPAASAPATPSAPTT